MHKTFLTSILIIFALAIICFGQESKNDAVQDHTDYSFTLPEFLADGRVYELFPQQDGKVIVSGYFDGVNGEKLTDVFRLNSDGSIDKNYFYENLGSQNKKAEAPDGKLIISTGLDVRRLNANGGIDHTFTPYFVSVNKLVVQTDGKVWFLTPSRIGRLNSDGSLDINVPLSVSNTNDFNLRRDGKLLVSVYLNQGNNFSTQLILLNSDGSIDNSFQYGLPSYTPIRHDVLPDGKVLVSDPINGTRRLNEDGSIDETFFPKEYLDIRGVYPQPNGDLNVVAYRYPVGEQIYRLKDRSRRLIPINFNEFNFSDKIVILPNGQFLVAGRLNTRNYPGMSFGILRYNRDATLAEDQPVKITDTRSVAIRKVLPLSDGKMYVAGQFSYVGEKLHQYVVRLNYDGTVDESFNLETETPQIIAMSAFYYGASDIGNAIAVQPDGKLLITFVHSILRFNKNGTLDRSFEINCYCTTSSSACHDAVFDIIPLEDENILIAGRFGDVRKITYQPGIVRDRVAILNADGTLNQWQSSISTGEFGPSYSGSMRAIRQEEGKILLLGVGQKLFYPESSTAFTKSELIRILPSGEPDNSFFYNSGPTGYYTYNNNFSLTVKGDILLSRVGFSPVKVNSNGQQEPVRRFRPQSPFTYFPTNYVLIPQKDDKILVSPRVGGYYGGSGFKPFRIYEDGSLDASFNLKSNYDGTGNVAIQEDGKYILSGKFAQEDGSVKYLARLNP